MNVIPRKICLLGEMNARHGLDLLERCAWLAKDRQLSLEFLIVGGTDRDERLRAIGNVEVTGIFVPQAVAEILVQAQCDIIWFPATAPDNFSFPLSAALDTDCKIVAFDVGAIASRLRASSADYVLIPLLDVLSPRKLVGHLCSLSIKRTKHDYRPVNYTSILREYYKLHLTPRPQLQAGVSPEPKAAPSP